MKSTRIIFFICLALLSLNLAGQKKSRIHLKNYSNNDWNQSRFFLTHYNTKEEIFPAKTQKEQYLEFEFQDIFVELEVLILSRDSIEKTTRLLINNNNSDSLILNIDNYNLMYSPNLIDFKIHNDRLVESSKIELQHLKEQYFSSNDASINYDSTLIIKSKRKNARDKYEAKQMSFIMLYPTKIESLIQLQLIIQRLIYCENNLYLETFNSLDSKLKNSKFGLKLREEIERKSELYAKLPRLSTKNKISFSTKSLDNQSINMENLIGKKILLNFWATWCKPCVAEMPALKNIYQKHPELVILGFSEDNDLETLKKFVKVNEIKWPQIKINSEFKNMFNVEAIPTTIFIDENGITKSIHVGGLRVEELESIVNQ